MSARDKNEEGKINTLEQEEDTVKDVLKEWDITINHNYFRAEKGVRPALHKLFSYSMIYLGYIMKFYYLTFTNDQLILFEAPDSRDAVKENSTRIKYEDIEKFTVEKKFIKYCIQFKYDSKHYYFYIDADGAYSFTGLNTSDINFHSLKERNFMGLLNK